MSAQRVERLPGITYRVDIDGLRIYITINEQDGAPFEVFIRCDKPELYEWITLATLLITRLLRAGTPLATIAHEMQDIHSSSLSSHFLPGGERCISMVARIGKVLANHAIRPPLEIAV